jgi:hypothetical protein
MILWKVVDFQNISYGIACVIYNFFQYIFLTLPVALNRIELCGNW